MSATRAAPFAVCLSVARVRNAAGAREGGWPGAPGRLRATGHAGDLPGKGELRVEPGERLTFKASGGGGYGPPAARDAGALARDRERGLVTAEGARLYRGAMIGPVRTVAAMAPMRWPILSGRG